MPLALTMVFSTYLLADANKSEFDDSVFMVAEIIKFGEKDFLERLGLKVNGELEDGKLLYASPRNPAAESPVGLVLSGGAARAFAHIGVLKALEEEGIFPDFIVTNSMGSLVGLLYAAGASPDLIERMIMEYPTDFLFIPRIPIDGGILDDYNMMAMLYQLFGELNINELEIPVVVLAEDLESRRQVSFMEGDFYKVLAATIAMPIAFPPVAYFVVTNNSFTFELETVGSFLEVMIIKNLAISAFCDYYKTDIHGLSAGLELDVDIALIGLVSFYINAYAGYDFHHKTAFGSISIGGNR